MYESRFDMVRGMAYGSRCGKRSRAVLLTVNAGSTVGILVICTADHIIHYNTSNRSFKVHLAQQGMNYILSHSRNCICIMSASYLCYESSGCAIFVNQSLAVFAQRNDSCKRRKMPVSH